MTKKMELDKLAVIANQKIKEKEFWLRTLSGAPVKSIFPRDYPIQENSSVSLKSLSFRLDGDTFRRLMTLRNNFDPRLHLVFIAVVAALCRRYTGKSDVLIGTCIYQQKQDADFINTLLPQRIPVPDGITFKQLLLNTRQILADATENYRYPMEILQQQLDMDESGIGFPFFDVAVFLENIQSPVYIEHVPFNIAFSFLRTEDAVEGCLKYNPELYARSTIQRLVEAFVFLLNTVIFAVDTPLSQIPSLPPREKQRLLVRLNDTATDFPRDLTIHQLFANQVAKRTHCTALIDNHSGQQLSYSNLDCQANHLACILRNKGIQSGQIVGMLLNRSFNMIIAIMAILKTGAAYLPIALGTPAHRINVLLKDSQLFLLITTSRWVEEFPFTSPREPEQVVLLMDQLEEVDGIIDTPVSHKHRTENWEPLSAAYCMFTSGSTGIPKGTLITHTNVLRLVRNTNYIDISHRDRLLQLSNYAFDGSVFDIFGSLLNGASLVLVSETQLKAVDELVQVVVKWGVSVFLATTALFNVLVELNVEGLSQVRKILFGGERVSVEHSRRALEHLGPGKLVHLYGPTETSVCATYHNIDSIDFRLGTVPIGLPLANTTVYILGPLLEPVPAGMAGELYVGGAALANGYLNRVELTAQRFVVNPFKKNQRLYRTGDLVRLTANGEIQFLDRIDKQVKLRGFRIELGEIESRLLSHPSIKETVVITTENESGERSLCAYIVLNNDKKTEISEIRDYLSRFLPDFMIPAHFHRLNAIPLNLNGKVDVQQLPRPQADIESLHIAPRSEKEIIIANIWKEVLNIDSVGIYDNYFEKGGNSLNIIQLGDKIKNTLGTSIPLVTLFRFPTIHSFCCYLNQLEPTPGHPHLGSGESMGVEQNESLVAPVAETIKHFQDSDIAVIGMSGRFPGASDIHQFWDNLSKGIESIGFLNESELEMMPRPAELYQAPKFVKTCGGVLDKLEYFDASFFNYTEEETENMSPQMRIFHECVWEAFENAGINPYKCRAPIGIFAGVSDTSNWESLTALTSGASGSGQLAGMLFSSRNFLSTRISYAFNLKGPATIVETACSTSLTAVDQARRSLLAGQCDLALAGGVSVTFPPVMGYVYQDGMINSPDGHCRPFDARAKGIIGGDGAGVVLLKSLQKAIEDGDVIHAIIKGSAVNNDGNQKVGFTAPSVEGQAAVIRAAQQEAGVKPENITYIEAHGTGTPLGDPVEIEALKLAFNCSKKQFCGIGSVKSNVGHLNQAAGIAGFIKTVLALKHRQIPPSVNIDTPSPIINFPDTPFYVVTRLKDWRTSGGPLQAGVSSFGIGGTNVHVVLEEAPQCLPPDMDANDTGCCILPISAEDEVALETITKNIRDYLRNNPSVPLADMAFTLQTGRRHLPKRRFFTSASVQSAVEILDTPNHRALHSHSLQHESPRTVFMFPGLGAQYVDMGRKLYQQESLFHDEMERCFKFLEPMTKYDIRRILYPDNIKDADSMNSHIWSVTENFELAQLVTFCFEYALAKLLISWGIKPDAVIGYSFGEYIAACIAGIFTLQDALTLVALRGQLVNQSPKGSMISVPMKAEKLCPFLDKYRVKSGYELTLAIDNGPSCVVSGGVDAVNALEMELKRQRVMCMRLPASHALHSKLMKSVTQDEKLIKRLNELPLNNPTVAFQSNVTGTWITQQEASDYSYWLQHMEQPVKFSASLKELMAGEPSVFIEVGPGRDLIGLVNYHRPKNSFHQLINLTAPAGKKLPEGDYIYFLNKLGWLWLYGLPVDWQRFNCDFSGRRLALPTYPFQRSRYWKKAEQYLAEGHRIPFAPIKTKEEDKKENMEDWFYQPTWMRSTAESSVVESSEGFPPGQEVCVLLGHTGPLIKCLTTQLEVKKATVVNVTAGNSFKKIDQTRYRLEPGNRHHIHRLINELVVDGLPPTNIIHLWNFGEEVQIQQAHVSDPNEIGDNELAAGFYTLVYLATAISGKPTIKESRILVVSSGIHDVTGSETLYPDRATLLAPCKTIPQEYPHIGCRSVDMHCLSQTPTTVEQQVQHIINELVRHSKEPVVAYRGKYRWLQRYEPVKLPAPTAITPPLRQEGVYLITGGMGNIGLQIAAFLARQLKARLVLIGRSPLPERQQWDRLLENLNINHKISRRIRAVKQMEAFGTQVMTASVDVSHRWSMVKLFNNIEKRFGTLHGIFHAVTVPQEDTFQLMKNMTPELCRCHFNAKGKGIRILEELTRTLHLDFCYLFSSNSSILGGLGLTAYAAANHFMDAFAHKQWSLGQTNWLSINWLGWQTENLKAEENNSRLYLTHAAMTPDEGIEAFKRVLFFKSGAQLVNSPVDLEPRLRHWVYPEPRRQSKMKVADTHKANFSRPYLSNPYVAPVTKLEKELAEIWARYLGVKEVGLNDDFLELGGDSLKAINVVSRIHKQCQAAIPLELFFKDPTVAAMAKFIEFSDSNQKSQIKKCEDREYYELSSAQRRLYILQQMELENTLYNMTQIIPLPQDMDLVRLEDVFKKLIQRHESLRTTFHMVDDPITLGGEIPVQKIHITIPFKIEMPLLSSDGSGKSTSNAAIRSFSRPYDLAQAPLFRVALFSADNRWQTGQFLLLEMHHSITDGVSLELLRNEFFALYKGESLPLSKLQYRDYVAWQNSSSQKELVKRQEEYWLKLFSGQLPVIHMPLDFPRPLIQSFEGNHVLFEFDKEETHSIKEMAKQQGTTLYMVLLSIFTIVLSKLSGQDDTIIGTSTAGRRHTDLESIIGMFVNTLVLRNSPKGEKTFKDYLREVKENTLQAFENQEYQFEDLVDKLSVRRDTGRNPIFDIMFSFLNQAEYYKKNAANGIGDHIDTKAPTTAKFDIVLSAVEGQNHIHLDFEYSTALFKEETIQRIVTYLKGLVRAVADSPRKKIKDIDIITEKEKNLILFEFNDTDASYPLEKTIQQLFKEKVEKNPDNISVVGTSYEFSLPHTNQLTYRELNNESNRFNEHLKCKGTESGNIVAMMLERSTEMIIGLLGILKTGASYLPIDPQYPEDRIDYMLKDSGSRFILVGDRGTGRTGNTIKRCQEKEKTGWTHEINITDFKLQPPFSPQIESWSESANAYIIYTSGTTGKPKGVLVGHRSLINLITYHHQLFGEGPKTRMSQVASPAFDAMAFEVWPCLTAGSALYIASDETRSDVEEMKQWLICRGIEITFQSTAIAELLLKEPWLENGTSPGILATAGDRLTVRPTLNCPFKVFNLYGPTEDTVWTTWAEVRSAENKDNFGFPVIGKPIANHKVYILSPDLALQPLATAGELYIGGAGLAKGYLNRPQLTQEKFIDFKIPILGSLGNLSILKNQQFKIFKTGDLTRLLTDGNIEFLGRNDHQVKIRGYRVEPGEIEMCLLTHPEIKEVVVISRKSQSVDNVLCAYYSVKSLQHPPDLDIPNPKADIKLNLKTYLAQFLPDYMIPTYFIKLDKIPLTPNGKIDRKALAQIQITKLRSQTHLAPRNEIEDQLSKIWAEVLGIRKQDISMEDNFFDIGGNSLRGTIMVSKIHKKFNVKLPLTELFNKSSIITLAETIKELAPDKYVTIEPGEKKDYYILSSAQKRLYVLQQMGLENTAYNMPQTIPLKKNMDLLRLEDIFKKLIRRHESLRTSFHLIDDPIIPGGEIPVQKIHASIPFSIDRFLPADVTSPIQLKDAQQTFFRPFDLTQAPLLRVGLISIVIPPTTRQFLLLDMHHIITDGISEEQLTNEFFALHEGQFLPPLKLQYRDYAEWQTSPVQKELMKKQEEYWVSRFSDELPILDLPMDYPRPVMQSFEGDHISFRLNQQELGFIKEIAIQNSVTLYMAIISVFTLLLSKLTRQEDIIIGTPTAGRLHTDLDHIIGMFVNTLALRNYPDGKKTFTEFLKDVKENTLKAFENQEYQFEDLVDRLSVRRDTGRNPIFDAMFSYLDPAENNGNGGAAKTTEGNVPDPEFFPTHGAMTNSKFDLTLTAIKEEDGFNFYFEYCKKLFRKETIKRFITYFKRILQSVSGDSPKEIRNIAIITAYEKEQILNRFNDSTVDYPREKTIHQLFEEHVEKTPDAIAVTGPCINKHWVISKSTGSDTPLSVTVTYHQLNQDANRQAQHLIIKGADTGETVGILMERSLFMHTSILAVWKSGSAYIPLDPNTPMRRIGSVLKDSGTKLVITHSQYITPQLKESYCRTITLPAGQASIHHYCNPQKNISKQDLAYVIYTSGSTGKPKGAMVEHMGMQNHMQAKVRDLQLNKESIVAQNASHTFDISVWQLFVALLNGGKTVIYGNDSVLNHTAFPVEVIKENITILEVVPSYLSVILEALESSNYRLPLHFLLVTGEEVHVNLVNRWFCKYPEIKMINAYGPTEASDDITHYIMDKPLEVGQVRVPIGKPLQNLNIYIVDKYMNLLPVGIKGELCVSGDGVGRGYLMDEKRTQEVFTTDPFKEEKNLRLYKTGDLARWLPDGNIEFLGRIDYQVKIRGFRIELGEIERCLMAHPCVKEVAVLDCVAQSSEKFLCAYFVAENPQECPDSQKTERQLLTDLKNYLGQILPNYMIPAHFTLLDKMPLTSNGKIDRGTLSQHIVSHKQSQILSVPRNHIDEKMIKIWVAVLEIPKTEIGIDQDFFELGGHSLKATILAARIHKEFNVKLPLVEIFNNSTIRTLVDSLPKFSRNKYITIPVAEKKDYYALSAAQKRLYVLHQMELGNTAYNMPQTIPLPDKIDLAKLVEVFQQLIHRHESLRTSFHLINDIPVQKIHISVPFRIEIIQPFQSELTDQSHINPVNGGAVNPNHGIATLSAVQRRFFRPFDLTQAPLLHVGLFSCVSHGQIRQYLLMDMHHIITDGTSEDILSNEFFALFNGEKLPPLTLQYKDYAQWQNRCKQRESMKQLKEYWLKQFSDELPILELPADYPRPELQSFEGDHYSFLLNKEEAKGMENISKKNGTTPYMTILAIFTILLSKLSGQEDIIVGTPTEGRKHVDLESIIGMFVNTLPLRNFPKGDKTFAEYLLELKDNTLNAFENQDFQFEDLVEMLSVRRDTGRNPIFDVMFNFLNQMEYNENNHSAEYLDRNISEVVSTSKFDLTLNASKGERDFNLTFEYCTKLFKKETIIRFKNYFKQILRAVSDNPLQKISDIEIITQQEMEQLLFEFNDTANDFPRNKTLHRLFQEQVEKSPDRISLVGISHASSFPLLTQIAFRELNQNANRLSVLLINKGVEPGSIISIRADRTVEMMAAILAILKADCAYLPIDPDYPLKRIHYMLADSNSRILLNDSGHVTDIHEADEECEQGIISEDTNPSPAFEIIDIRNLNKLFSLQRQAIGNPVSNAASRTAYVIYTSGSTGKPKGVVIQHGALVNFINGMINIIDFKTEDTILSLTTICFDIFGLETLLPLTTGTIIVMGNRIQQLDPGAAGRLMEQMHVSLFQTTPSRLQLFLTEKKSRAALARLKTLIVGGEDFPINLLKDARRIVSGDIYNVYGPTETTVWSTAQNVTKKKRLNIGKPIANTRIYILNRWGMLHPRGVAGELCIGGLGLAQGYLNQLELTAEMFVNFKLKSINSKTPTIFNLRLYRTGDLARWLPNGDIEFLGRIDFQVKIRGYRIELQEIENRLLTFPGIKETAVCAQKSADGDNLICAYYSAESTDKLTKVDNWNSDSQFRSFLSRFLPGYMIPSFFIPVEKIPLTPNGKTDRNALAQVEISTLTSQPYIVPRNEIEKKIVEIWADILGLSQEKIGIDHDFFQLGGHSLKVTTMASRLHSEFDVKLPLARIFKNSSIRALAEIIRTFSKDKYLTIPSTEKKDYYITSSAQKRYYLRQQRELHRISDNLPKTFALPQDIDIQKLEEVFQQIVRRHDSLRTSFHMMDDPDTPGEEILVQRVHSALPFKIELLSPHQLINNQGTTNSHSYDLYDYRRVPHSFFRPFDLNRAPLFRVGLLNITETPFHPGDKPKTPVQIGLFLLLDAHLIISDGVSHEILRNEFFTLYKEQDLPPLKLQYRDFVVWQNSVKYKKLMKQQEQYWLRRFSGELPILNLPLDFPRPAIKSIEGDEIAFKLTNEERLYIEGVAQQNGTTLYMTMFAIYTILLSKLSGQEDIIIGTPSTGRRNAGVENLIGQFANKLAMRIFPRGEKSFREYLGEIKEITVQAFENQDYQFEDIVEKLSMKWDSGRHPIFDVLFHFVNRMGYNESDNSDGSTHPNTMEDVNDKPRSDMVTFNFDLFLTAVDTGDSLFLVFLYCTKLFKEETIREFLSGYKGILKTVFYAPHQKISEIEIITGDE